MSVHFLSKVFSFVTQPGNLLLLVILIGTLVAWLRPNKSGRVWLTLLSAVLLFVTISPVHYWVARPLENRFPPPASLSGTIDGIIVLGGFLEFENADQRGVLAINQRAERVMTTAVLALEHPTARLVITGRGEDNKTLVSWFAKVGIDEGRFEYEPNARNTFEMALLTHRKVQPGPGERWLLVTSAQNMPRTVGVFRKVGWPVIPYPVDYQTAESDVFANRPFMAEKLFAIDVTAHEWAGLLAFYLMDRTDELFPAP
jgi:uncharacterized SAM-binding protein YcdF (DUF218 family)